MRSMSTEMMKEYYLGLDIGTNSCGFAATDENYNILRKCGKKVWGVRLFEEAQTATERRGFRSARRRLDRKKLKIQWLNDIFAPHINKIDPTMLTRIKYSNLWESDKFEMDNRLVSKDSIFGSNSIINGEKYTDRNYYEEYPTIYHLRKELLFCPAKDVRFLYLALHHILKNRGHFLFKGDFAENESLSFLFRNLVDTASAANNEDFIDGFSNVFTFSSLDDQQEKEILSVIKNAKGIRETKNKIYSILCANSKASKALVDSFVTGKKVKISDFFLTNSEEKLEISFDSDDYEQELSQISSFLTEDQISILEILKQIFSTLQLKKILKDNNYICEAMVGQYEKHRLDLYGDEKNMGFKAFIHHYYPSQYNNMFRKTGDSNYVNYAAYVGGSIFKGEKQVVFSKERSQDLFYKFVLTILSKQPEVFDDSFAGCVDKIKQEIENRTFLPKLRTKINAVLPNKLIENELKQILRTNAEKYSWLKEIDESGISNLEKIVSILKFRVPYFVGPLGNNLSKTNTHWSERTSDLPYNPWNFEKIVDFDAAEDKFILNMTNHCTYLKGEKVLPKHSLLYSKFRVLNELNKLTINGNAITVDLKKQLYIELFQKKKRVTIATIKDFLISENIFSKDEDIQIGGIDKEFKNGLNSLNDLCSRCGFTIEYVYKNAETFEQVISWATIIGDKNRLLRRIKKYFGDFFSEQQLKSIKGLTCSDWGSLSKRFLQDMVFDNKKTQEKTTIINELWETNQNLQQIIFNSNYSLQDELAKLNEIGSQEITYDAVENMACSPAVKRGVWQSLKIIKEIDNIMGRMPSRIFIEVARTDEEKGEQGRKLSRKDNLYKIYNSKDFSNVVNKLNLDVQELFNNLNKTDNTSFRSDKLFLYFMQLGKCAYSGEPIPFEDLVDDNKYDIDHIIPQSKLKDDSINNKVLAKKTYNGMKTDIYPIYEAFPNWVNSQKTFWKTLNKLGLMSNVKYEKLIRQAPLSASDLEGFVNRQIVETNQTSKAVIDILKESVGPQTKIVYSKAKIVSDFRQKFDIVKVREANDLHHAKDAFLNIVVGNAVYTRFTEDPQNFYRDKTNDNYKLTTNVIKLFDNNKYIYSPSGEVVWNTERDIAKVKNTCFANDCLVSRMSYSNLNGAFYKQTIHKSLKNNPKSEVKIGLKGENNLFNNIDRYGGYSDINNAYFMLIESEDNRGKTKKTLEAVPIYILQKYAHLSKEAKETQILEFICEQNELKNAKVLIPKINYKSALKIGSGEFWIGGKSGSSIILHNANQWHIDNNSLEYIKKIIKYNELKKAKKDGNLKDGQDKVIISPARNEKNKEIALTREENIQLYDLMVKQYQKKCYQGTNLANVGKTIYGARDVFVNLTVLVQAEALTNIMKGLSTGKNIVDLSQMNLQKALGVLSINKNITNSKIYLIIKSDTGLKEKRIRL